MKIAIVGPPGTGKTYLAAKMREQGHPAYDADSMLDLGYWINKLGIRESKFPKRVDYNWVKKHDFVWDQKYLTRFIIAHDALFFFGMSANAYDLLELFDKVYYLDLSEGKIAERLVDVNRTNYYGKEERLRKSILESVPYQIESARKKGFTFLDASQPAEETIKKILNI